MKVIIEQHITLQAQSPRYEWIVGELHRCGIKTGPQIAPMSGKPGTVVILPHVFTTDAKNFEAVADVITTYNKTASPNLSLAREGHFVYRLIV